MTKAIYQAFIQFSHAGDETSARAFLEQAVPGASEISIRQSGWDITDEEAAEVIRLSSGEDAR